MKNKDLYLQLSRDTGTLIELCSVSNLNKSDKANFEKIADRMDDAMSQLQVILYPESLQS